MLSLVPYSREIDGKTYVLSKNRRQVVCLNLTASFLFKKFNKGMLNQEKLIASLAKNFSISKERATEDVKSFLNIVEKLELIT